MQIRPRLFLYFLLLPLPIRADVLNLLVENDVWTGTDRHYTSGVMLNYISDINEGPRRLRDMGIRFPGIEPDDKMHVAVALGHEIYTPTDIDTAELLPEDRPYAAHAYLAFGFTTENPAEIETWRVSLGVIGPGAGGERIQNTLHRLIEVDEAQGWPNQLDSEFVVSIAYEKKWLKAARSGTFAKVLQTDFIPHASASTGTLGTHIGGGGMVRIGHGLENDYGPPRVRPSLPVSQYYERDATSSWYFYLGVDARWIAHNIFLDGNNFRDSHAVDREDFVGDVQAGFVWNNKRFRVAYTYVIRSREFVQQAERDAFGALSISAHF